MKLSKAKMDVLFIHPGRKSGLSQVPLISLGLLALADFINERGIPARVLNLPLMLHEKTDFNVIQFIKESRVLIVAISLHWYPQLYEALSLAKKIKAVLPEVKVVFGGFTSSLFHEELLEKFLYIDYIIRGDSEIPLLSLCNFVLFDKGRIDLIPNLTWRNGTKITVNRHTYAVSKKTLNSLKYFNVRLLINSLSMYLNNPLSFFSKFGNIAFYNPGRGCPVNCSFCGGGCVAQRLMNHRGVVKKSTSSILRDFKDANDIGLDYLFISFDPYPKSSFYTRLFDRVRPLDLKLNLFFESWGLPSSKFLSSFASTFQKPILTISPLTGSERVRRLNMGFFYTNKKLYTALDHCNKLGISVRVFLSAGLPFEEDEDFEKTLKFAKYLKSRFSLHLIAGCIRIDPGSPMHLDPVKFKITHEADTLETFIEASLIKDFDRRPRYSTHVLSEDDIINRHTILGSFCDAAD